MKTTHFSCIRCGRCCHTGIQLGLAEALDYDREFLLALVFSMETWNLSDFSQNKPATPITLDQLLTTLAFRKDKLAMDQSRDTVFQAGRVKASGERVATFLTVSASGLGDFEAGGTRCPALDNEGLCAIHNRRPLACRAYPLDPLFPEMLQNVPLAAIQGSQPCDFSEAAPPVWSEGKLASVADREILSARQEAIRRDSLFLPYYGLAAPAFKPMPALSEILLTIGGNGSLDLPIVPALVYLAASGQVSPDRAELCLERQIGLADAAVSQALARKDKTERARTGVLRNCLEVMRAFRGRIASTADGLAEG